MKKVIANLDAPPLAVLAAIELTASYELPIEWASQPTAVVLDTEIRPLPHADILRAIARNAIKQQLYGSTVVQKTLVDAWLTFSQSFGGNAEAAAAQLQSHLATSTYLVADRVTIADLAVFEEVHVHLVCLKKAPFPAFVQRWYRLIAAQPAVQAALGHFKVPAAAAVVGGAKKVAKPAKVAKSESAATGNRKQEGTFIELPGAEKGKVVVRFPPEASGYLHIGHAKAALLNQYYQQAYDGKLIMRFDDTNPAKETVEFEKVILEDLKLLQIQPDVFTHTSDYFDVMLDYCEQLMRAGKAYADGTAPEQMKAERDERKASAYRANTVDQNFAAWREMQAGSAEGQKYCIRAKINMESPNGCLRDPTIYRCKDEPHPKTGTKYRVYPTYDFACPIVDAIENVTHTLRTTEYLDRDDQFYWFIEALNLRRPHIWAYSRLNMTNTVLSKRKLTWFVNSGLVDGWDDARFPTVRGILRRGMTVQGLREFIIAQGSSKSVVFMEWDKIWTFNKKVIDPIAPRYTALERTAAGPVRVHVAGNGAGTHETVEVALHPKNADVGVKRQHQGPNLWIDYADAEALRTGEFATFIGWGNMLVQQVRTGADGRITDVDVELRLDNTDFKKTLKLTWLCDDASSAAEPTPVVCVYFEHIIAKPVLSKNEDFKDFIGKETRIEVPMLGEPDLRRLKEGDIIQLTRRGFFRVDRAYVPESEFTGAASPLVLFSIPDGHTKAQPTSGQPIAAKAQIPAASSANEGTTDLNARIVKQGDLVRDLKAKKTAKPDIEAAVKTLLTLKADFKQATGQDWKPAPTAPATAASTTAACPAATNSSAINDRIVAQGDIVRDLKAKKAAKPEVEGAVKQLLALKAEFKASTGQDWKPSPASATVAASVPAPSAAPSPAAGSAAQIDADIVKQGDLVRDLKAKKAAKPEIEAAVKTLLTLKADYKQATGTDWKPSPTNAPVAASAPATTAAPSPAAGSAAQIDADIVKQGDLVRDLKAKKAAKPEIEAAVKTLLTLKADYKQATGTDWKPGQVAPMATPAPVSSASASSSAAATSTEAISAEITKQGDLVRDLKSKKAAKPEIDAAVKSLLTLKADYKKASGQDWKPGQITQTATAPVSATSTAAAANVPSGGSLDSRITEQGNLVRDLKANKAAKSEIDAAVKSLLGLKADYKQATGQDWKPAASNVPAASPTSKPKPVANSATAASAEVCASSVAGDINANIIKQGDLVRDLKSKKAAKADIDAAVQALLALKADYKKASGQDWKPGCVPPATVAAVPTASAATVPTASAAATKSAKASKPKPAAAAVKASAAADSAEGAANAGPKKQTRLGMEALKAENLPDWYSQVITKSEMIEYYDVSGCYILRPWSIAIWRTIQNFFQDEITKLGVKECYFPMFVSKAALEKEKDHIADFSPEVAWVTRSGDSELAEPIAIRPTSETIMYPAFAKWIQSHRDLPLKLNQWSNVVRWEFKHPQPFLRTREFLWQEGHTAFAEQAQADAEVLDILTLYARIYEELLAIPVRRGRKSEKEKFAGGAYTTTVEAFVSASGRSIQGATSHHLGQNFSRMFDITFEDPLTQEKQFVYQNSWGITTRTIGVMIMVHGDDKGLVLPPRVAPTQAVIVPCGITANATAADRAALQASCDGLVKDLLAAGIRVEGDFRDNYSPGWKFNHWELKGTPIRVELGPKDMRAEQLVLVRRDTGEKVTVRRADAGRVVAETLEAIQAALFARAQQDFVEHMVQTKCWPEFCANLERRNLLCSPFCGGIECEDQIKEDSAITEPTEPGAMLTGAKSLCIPFEQPTAILPTDACINPNCSRKPKFWCYFGRSY